MALITCPECGKQISDRASTCIHCGCPFEKDTNVSKKIVRYGKPERSSKTEQLFKSVFPNAGWEALYSGQQYIVIDGVTENFARDAIMRLMDSGIQLEIEDSMTSIAYASVRDRNYVACPNCGSIEYEAGARGYSLVTGFIGSSKTMLTCVHCGHRWKPGK